MKERKTTSVTIDKELHKKISEYAKKEERTITFVIRKAFEMYLESKGKQ